MHLFHALECTCHVAQACTCSLERMLLHISHDMCVRPIHVRTDTSLSLPPAIAAGAPATAGECLQSQSLHSCLHTPANNLQGFLG